MAVLFLKEQFAQKWTFSHNLLSPKPMESRVNFLSPQNISGASQLNSDAALF